MHVGKVQLHAAAFGDALGRIEIGAGGIGLGVERMHAGAGEQAAGDVIVGTRLAQPVDGLPGHMRGRL